VHSFAGLDGSGAAAAYLQPLALVSHLVSLRGERALGRLCRELGRSRLERALQRQYGLTPAELEHSLLAALRS
jgi:hypothetical protein